ncbi:MAG TPA: hypothetical protein VHP57_00685 [Acidimicrobiia bacterium]|jgi:uncharacterized membrane protein|nr:hypothetical protein [Acidimicrobiia bacterium]
MNDRGHAPAPAAPIKSNPTAPRTKYPWGWFTVWFLVGGAYCFCLLAMLTIGVFLLPIPVLATVVLARREDAQIGAAGLISGLGIPLYWVAYLNRDGPGEICNTTRNGTHCMSEWSPWPWLAVGTLFVLLGVGVALRVSELRRLRANEPSRLR